MMSWAIIALALVALTGCEKTGGETKVVSLSPVCLFNCISTSVLSEDELAPAAK